MSPDGLCILLAIVMQHKEEMADVISQEKQGSKSALPPWLLLV